MQLPSLQLCIEGERTKCTLTQSVKPLFFLKPQSDNSGIYSIALLQYISHSWDYLHGNQECIHHLEDMFICLSTFLRVNFVNLSVSKQDGFQRTFELT